MTGSTTSTIKMPLPSSHVSSTKVVVDSLKTTPFLREKLSTKVFFFTRLQKQVISLFFLLKVMTIAAATAASTTGPLLNLGFEKSDYPPEIDCGGRVCRLEQHYREEGCFILDLKNPQCVCHGDCPGYFDRDVKKCQEYVCKTKPSPKPTPKPEPRNKKNIIIIILSSKFATRNNYLPPTQFSFCE